MNTNISATTTGLRRGCEIPDKLHAKIKQILNRDKIRNNTAPVESFESNSLRNEYKHYERIRIAMKRRCVFHLQELLDHMEVWFSDYNSHEVPLTRDNYFLAPINVQNEDARAYIATSDNEIASDFDPKSISNSKRSDWQYWWRRYLRGQWPNFPQIAHEELPTIEGGEKVNYVLWQRIIQKLIGKIKSKQLRDRVRVQARASSVSPPTSSSTTTTTLRPTQDYIRPTDNYEILSESDADYESSGDDDDLDDEYYQNYDDFNDPTDRPIDTTPYAFYEAPHWGDVGRPKEIGTILQTHGIDTRSISDDEVVLDRPERQIIFGLIMAAIAIGSLLYSTTDMSSMASTANRNQAATIQNINDLDHRLQIQEKSIHLINKTLAILEKDISRIDTRLTIDELIDECNIALEMLYSESTRIIRGISALTNNQLSPDLVKMDALTRNLMKLRDRMEARGYVLALERLEHVFTMPVSYILYGNGSLWAFAHINCFRKSNTYQLWEFNSIPFLSTSDTGQTAITIKPEKKLIGVSEDDSRHVLLDHRAIDRCGNVGQMKVCDEMSVINTKSKQSCLSALYLEDIDSIKDNCRWYSADRKEFIQQINSNQFVAYFTQKDNLKITCTDGKDIEEKRVEVLGAHRITLQGGCRAYSDHHILEGKIEFSLQTTTYQINTINVSDLLSNEYFTITDKNWDQWEKIRKDIGSPEGIVFRDVSSMYRKYRTNQVWNFGIRSLLGIITPLIIIALIYYVVRRFCCRKSNQYNQNQGVSYSKVRGQDQVVIQPPPPVPFELGPMPPPASSRSDWLPRSGRTTPAGSGPPSPDTDAKQLTFAANLESDPLKTPNTSKRLMLQTGWTTDFKNKIKNAADHIRQAERMQEEEEANRIEVDKVETINDATPQDEPKDTDKKKKKQK